MGGMGHPQDLRGAGWRRCGALGSDCCPRRPQGKSYLYFTQFKAEVRGAEIEYAMAYVSAACVDGLGPWAVPCCAPPDPTGKSSPTLGPASPRKGTQQGVGGCRGWRPAVTPGARCRAEAGLRVGAGSAA